MPDDTEAAAEAWGRARDIEDRILETEATTIAGLAVQAELVIHKDSLLRDFLDTRDCVVFENMCSALNKMQGNSAPRDTHNRKRGLTKASILGKCHG